jgi:hypothetical protein
MTTLPMSSPSDEPRADEAGRDRPPLAALQTTLLAVLGRPPGLYRVAILPLWQNYYRVNVFIGDDPTAVRIAHSYFVEAGDGGRIVTAVPPVVREYP